MFIRKLYPLLFLLVSVAHAQAPKEDPKYTKAVLHFKSLFNEGKYDSIFSLFSSDMKAQIPIDKTVDFLSATKSVSGKMVSANFESYESSYAIYKAQFERRVYSFYISLNNSQINGLLLQPYMPANLPKLNRNLSKLILPFKGKWTVLWGGDTKELNYHVEVAMQKGAFDFIVTDSTGKSYRTDSKTNQDYYAFGKDILAVCDAQVIMVVDGINDNIPGTVNPLFVTGNTVILKTSKNEFIVYAHFQKHSILVKEGQTVRQGDLLGKCGNSGNSTEPHLHFHMQNVEDMNVATGAKCYFTNIIVNGIKKAENSPIRNEKVENQN
ncbi:peptidoglycan DD-metalloendopeptidase family protein [Cytophagaceae bacterium DM2B3-1]|uniref:Peptidoglycan DD-metalloendopeptidase family protein n=1 Tax=Xanthocytophaga flava TaxID=3048013 RepID=A0ABT7CKF3_9BACT|nr:peptidoglycan DD-metalloendopeptidase family protein [Xanthocytophaga flavus]MDJ1494235.1 peptidoglycan DD-metalloendopeptidase family protein [Xanthocytophaga flavus]